MELGSAVFWIGLAQIIWVDLLLSGDNAVVIALAARSLPPPQQRRAILLGSAAAIAMRVLLTLVAVQMLTLPWLKLAGAILLLYIGVKLLRQDPGVAAPGTAGLGMFVVASMQNNQHAFALAAIVGVAMIGSCVVSGVSGAGFTTTAQPAASAGAIFIAASTIG